MQTGADGTRFIQQWANFGLKGRIPLMGSMNCTDQSVIRTMGAEPEGIVTPAHFAEGSDNPAHPEIREGLRGEVQQDALALRLLYVLGRDVDRQGAGEGSR